MMTFLFKKLLNKFSGKVIVDVDAEEFHFRWGNRSLSIKTFLYLSNIKGKYRILSVGENFEGSDQCLKVCLFNGEPLAEEIDSRKELLESFLRYGFIKISSRKLFMPTVLFQNENRLNETLGGYQKDILIDAAKKASAYEVEFIS